MSENHGRIINVTIEDEMKVAYIDYSMSVIVSRALPDVRDGLKPVHRRILYGMSELGVYHNKPFKKSARIVGEVLGKYHPHGDTAVYDTMVRMAQPWSLRYPMVDGQGNYGSVDGDNPAAMRYTEARLTRVAEEMLADIDKNVVDFGPNFDDSLKEPLVLPSKIPNLLVNGTTGIAVGMATNMAPHNLSEIVDGVVAYINNPEITVQELMDFVSAPDFPTGGIIYGTAGVKQAFFTGRGKITIRAKVLLEPDDDHPGRERIVITELPYQVNKAVLIEKTAQLINEKKIEGISTIRDESDRDGMRIVYELKRDAVPNVIINTLFKNTSLQVTFGVNNVALVKGRPMTLNLRQLIKYFVEHRHEVVVRRTQYDLAEAEKKAHILSGLLKALDHIDEIIALIKASPSTNEAKEKLMLTFDFSEIQARAVLEMRLQRLTGLERDKLQNEYDELMKSIAYYQSLLADESLRMGVIKDELVEIKAKYGDKRRTQIEEYDGEILIEDLIADDQMIITISNEGYIKRTPLAEYKAQARGGRGSKGVASKTDDFTAHLFSATNHNYVLIFTDPGRLYWLKVYEIPEGSKNAKGRPLQNLIAIEPGERVRAVINIKTLSDVDYIKSNYLVFCTEKGMIKKTSLESYSRPRSNGILALGINEDDRLLDVKLTDGNSHLIMALRSGRAIRFHEELVRPTGRGAAGVRGVRLANEEDRVVGLVCNSTLNQNASELLVVSEKGYGKRSDIEEYRITNRGGKGVKTISVTEKTGYLVNIMDVADKDDLMIVKKSGIMIRLHISDLRVMGRATQGVRLVRIGEDDAISSVAKVERDEEQEVHLPDINDVLPEDNTPDEPDDDAADDAE
ncbi:MAG: DNA gyrase subunit A [Cytophagales bacterium]|nr:MAG: DNA gyrase subunit A [Cytophagales bacterium]TAF61858.1 MAG: DNA gyrase subunit A [Cytophagales bacterium]